LSAVVVEGGVAGEILYSGTTQRAGVYLLRIRMPSLAAGEHQVTVRFGGATSPAGVTHGS
jgi:uncharacterized protein (TIGR03437 family)